MRCSTVLVMSALQCMGCGEAFTDGETTLTITGSRVADGVALHTVEVCVTPGAESEVSTIELSLTATSGQWQLPVEPTTPTQTTVRIDDTERCRTEGWIAPVDAGLVRFQARLGEQMLVREEITLTAAELESVDILPSTPFLNSDGSSNITLNLRANVASDAFEQVDTPSPTKGTRVELSITSEPISAAAVDDPLIIFGERESALLVTAPNTERVIVEVQQPDSGATLGRLELSTPPQPESPETPP